MMTANTTSNTPTATLTERAASIECGAYMYRRLADLLGHYSQFEVDISRRGNARVRRKPKHAFFGTDAAIPETYKERWVEI